MTRRINISLHLSVHNTQSNSTPFQAHFHPHAFYVLLHTSKCILCWKYRHKFGKRLSARLERNTSRKFNALEVHVVCTSILSCRENRVSVWYSSFSPFPFSSSSLRKMIMLSSLKTMLYLTCIFHIYII